MDDILRNLKAELGRVVEYTIVPENLNNADAIVSRCAGKEKKEAAALSLMLRYLYLSDGPLNLTNGPFNLSKDHLSTAELIMVKHLKSRTNGNGRRRYGGAALRAARKARYQCEACANADVRVLVLDHANGRDDVENFIMFCADCHQIKSRLYDWTGKKKEEIQKVEA